MPILQVEKVISSGLAPSFSAVATESVTNLGQIMATRSLVTTIPLPVTTFDRAYIESTLTNVTVTRTGILTVDCSNFTGGSYGTTYYFYVVFAKGLETVKVKYSFTYMPFAVDIVYKTPGTYTLIVPNSVSSITVLGIGAGGGGATSWASSGGGGGCLAYVNNMTVTPGQSISITVPGPTPQGTNGGNAVIGTYLTVQGGQYSQSGYLTPNAAGSVTPTGAGQGGHVSGQYGGGGGAGGYGSASGTDAQGGYTSYGSGYNGSNGAAAGGSGYNSSTYSFGGGGGVYPYGRGTSGIAGSVNNGNSFYSDYRYGGQGGSGGERGADNSNSSQTSDKNRTIFHGCGGNYGGGGAGGGTSVSGDANFSKGAQGVVRVFYGTTGMSFPTSAPKQTYTVEI